MLSGNTGTGGVLIESKGTGTTQTYAGKIGEDVVSSGIVLKSAKAQIAALAQDIYLRTGGPTLGSGNIVFDAGQGANEISMYANDVNAFVTENLNIWVPPTGTSGGPVVVAHSFGLFSALIGTPLVVQGEIVGCGASGILVDGCIQATGNINAGGILSHNAGPSVGTLPSNYLPTIDTNLAAIVVEVSTFTAEGPGIIVDNIINKYYQTAQLGNEALISILDYSCRDVATNLQFHTASFVWLESHWQQMVRLGLGTGGVSWGEIPVTYQGQQLYPYPGKAAWTGNTFLQLSSLTMYDAANGECRDRPGPYVNPTLAGWNQVSMEAGYKLVR